MPETMTHSCGWISSIASACLMAFRMPKSPQPGHQVDFSVLLKSLTSSIDLDLRTGLAPARGDDLVGRDRSTIVLQDGAIHRLASVGTQHVTELAGEVLLDQDQRLRLIEGRTHALPVERPDLHEVQQ